MTNRRALSLALALSALAAGAASAEQALDFDSLTVDVKEIVAAAKEQAKKDKAPDKGVAAAYIRAERDCANIVFEPGGADRSQPIWLSSTEYIEECTNTGDPRNGGGRNCWERPGYTYREKVEVEISNRQPTLPWEREVFQVCLEGRWLDLDPVKAAYDYRATESAGRFTLVAGKRTPMDPDAAGVAAGNPFNTGTSIGVEFTDRWASYYGGERLELKLTLKEDKPNWFDPTLLEKTVSLATADSHKVDFADYAGELAGKLQNGKNYYVVWGFKRVGGVSKPTYMKRGETNRVSFAPSSGQPSAR